MVANVYILPIVYIQNSREIQYDIWRHMIYEIVYWMNEVGIWRTRWIQELTSEKSLSRYVYTQPRERNG